VTRRLLDATLWILLVALILFIANQLYTIFLGAS
jgi:hypothetical protein